MKKAVNSGILFSIFLLLALILSSCSVKQKDLIGLWTTDFQLQWEGGSKADCEISLSFDDSIELKGLMVMKWTFSSPYSTLSPDTFMVPFVYKIEGSDVFIEGHCTQYTFYGEFDRGLIKMKLKYKNGNLEAEGVELPNYVSKREQFSFTLERRN